MHLGEIRTHILRRLRGESGRAWFAEAQRLHSSLRPWPTIEPFLEVFESREKVGYQRQDALLRIVVDQAQRGNEPERWHELLLYLFLPGLVRLRARTWPGACALHDLDGILSLSFFEIVRHYPLTRKGSVAAGILLDTAKRYFRALRQEQAHRSEQRQMVAYAHLAANKYDGGFDFGDHQAAAPQLTVDDEERQAMDAWLQQRGVPGEDSALLVATSVLGMTIRDYMGVRRSDEREFQRLKKRRQRARQKLLERLGRRRSA